nr:hypothetical protein GCM10020092_003100 [Actinoplanes digitatis]
MSNVDGSCGWLLISAGVGAWRGRGADVSVLADRFGRVATDLRVSLTDRCNLRCTYCMPEEGLAWMPQEQQLTDDEVGRLIRIAVERLGVTDVRFTGGEPLIRRGLVGIISAAAALSPRPKLSVTTNGIGLERMAVPLLEAGLDRVNVSLDTLSPERFRELTHRDRHADVLKGLAGAARAGLTPVKINTVLMRGVNDDEAPELLLFALNHGYELRFIEQMPLDAQHKWDRHEMVTAEAILASLEPFGLQPDPVSRGTALAETWIVPGYRDAARQPGPGGRDRQRDQAFLRRLRSHPAYGRRSGPQLPLRHRRVRPAWPATCRRVRRRDHDGLAGRDVGQARGPRHRRPVVPAARPPDVGDRRLKCLRPN